MNVFNKKLENCSYGNTAVTGYARDGMCNNYNSDTGSHHVCMDISRRFKNSNFCQITKQPNWCNEKSNCHNSNYRNCNKKNWCVCEWAFSDVVDKIGCENVSVNCEATNLKTIYNFKNNPKYKQALDCLKHKCNI